jgi:hypothetical protein
LLLCTKKRLVMHIQPRQNDHRQNRYLCINPCLHFTEGVFWTFNFCDCSSEVTRFLSSSSSCDSLYIG